MLYRRGDSSKKLCILVHGKSFKGARASAEDTRRTNNDVTILRLACNKHCTTVRLQRHLKGNGCPNDFQRLEVLMI